MSTLMLTKSQKELIKFLKIYTLNRPKQKKTKIPVSSIVGSDREALSLLSSNMIDVHPAQDAFIDFNPDGDKIDMALYNGIVEHA